MAWAGVMPMAIAAIGRAFRLDFMPYRSDYDKTLFKHLQNASIINVLGQYRRLLRLAGVGHAGQSDRRANLPISSRRLLVAR